MRKNSKFSDDDSINFTLSNLKRYTYLLGLLHDMKDSKFKFQNLTTSIENNIQNVQESI